MKFSKFQALSFGWRKTKSNFFFFASLLILIGGLVFTLNTIGKLLQQEGFLYSSWVIDLFDFVLQMIITLGLIKISLNFYDETRSKIVDIFSQWRLTSKYLIALIIYFLIAGIGFVLLVFPGIYFLIRFYFFDYFLVDKKMGPIESLKESWHATKGSTWNLFLLFLVLILINILGGLVFLIGLFVTIPVSMLALAFVYRKLSVKLENE